MITNQQQIEKIDYDKSGYIEYHSVWETLQGEGPLAGTPAVFIRLTGCNLCCPLCDTEYTSKRARTSPEEMVVVVEGIRPSGLVVLTGGEPFRQNVIPLILSLIGKDYKVQIETNGTHFPEAYNQTNSNSELWFGFGFKSSLTIVCSPKTSTISPNIIPFIDAWKYIVEADHIHTDGLPITSLGYNQLPARPPDGTPPEKIFVQPLHMGHGWNAHKANDKNQKAALASCMKFGYRLSLQQHKLLGLD